MEFFAKTNNKVINIYHYEPDLEKLYEYKKERIRKDDVLSTTWIASGGYDIKKGAVISSGSLDFRGEKYFSGEPTYKSEKEKREFLEQYCAGKLDCQLLDDGRQRVLFPEKMQVLDIFSKDEPRFGKFGYYQEYVTYVTVDGVLLLTSDLYLLERIIRGNVYFSDEEMNLIGNQLECFSFSDDPIDTVSLKTLNLLCKDKESFDFPSYIRYTSPFTYEKSDIIDKAERGAKVMEKIKNNCR